MKGTSTDIKNGPIYISKDLQNKQKKSNKELLASLLKEREIFIEMDNKGEHTALNKMRSMMGNHHTTYKQTNIKKSLIILLLCSIILYLVALVGSTILKIPLDSFYSEIFNYFFPGR